jgi:DNA-binding IclR family transcriptional regulator
MDATPADLGERFAGASFAASGPRARVRDVETLADAVAEARSVGYAAVDEEFEAGVAGVSAPIRDFTGTVVAALNVSAPAVRIRARLPEVGERTREAAEMVSRQLGWGAGSSRSGIAGPS